MKAISVEVIRLPDTPAVSISASSPGRRGALLMASSPSFTMARFSPVSGTTSATVASAATSTQGMAAASPPSAHTSFQATPAPHRNGNG